MFSWFGEPFVCCPLYMLFSCVFLIFLWEDCSLGYQRWPLIVGIWALRPNRMKTLLCFSFLSAGAQGTQLDRFLVGNSSRWYHCVELRNFALLHPSLPGAALVDLCISAGHCLVREVLTGGEKWGLFLCPPAQKIAHAAFSCSSQMYFFLATCITIISTSWGITCRASLMLTGGAGHSRHS